MTKKPTKEDLIDQLQRLQAEFENYRKRTEREQEHLKARLNEHLIKELIPIIDNLALALEHKENREELIQGVVLIRDQLTHILTDHGVTEIPTEGIFNPAQHEAITTEQSDKAPGTIIKTYQRGYRIGEKVLRPARVSVAKGGTHDGK